jgi:4-hydroxy-tetrahydrodipicolinate synthase
MQKGILMRFKPQGIIAAMVTPFTKGGEYVDFEKAGALAQRLVDQGVHGLFPCGTTGEGLLLSAEERKELLEEIVQTVGKRTLVIAQTGCLDTATTIELTRHAQEAGANAAAIVAPGFFAYDDLALKAYYASIAKAVPDFPVLVYNIPACARNTLTPDFVLGLAESVENIVGIKDSSGNMAGLTQLLGSAPKGFHVINGADDYGYQAFLAGAPAAVSGMSNVVAEIYLAVYNNLQAGRLKQAWDAQVKLEKVCRTLFYGRNIALYKEAMRMRGFDAGAVRPPQRELTTLEKKALAKALEGIGIL